MDFRGEQSRRSAGGALGGALTVWDASMANESATHDSGPYWSSARGTCVAAHTVIDRCTSTAAEELLFWEEYVPPGTSFKVRMLIEGPDALGYTPSQLASVLVCVLDKVKDGKARLGASTAAGWGFVEWQLRRVRRFSPQSITNWAKQPGSLLLEHLMALKEADLAELRNSGRDLVQEIEPARLTFTIDLHMEGPFLVNDASRTKAEKDATSDKPNHAPLRLAIESPVLPGSSFHGVLRSHSERIVRTILRDRASENVQDPQGKPGKKISDVANIGQVTEFDAVSCLFGAPGWRSPIRVTEFTLAPGTQKPPIVRQEFIAIDRFTGGGADEQKFNADAFASSDPGGFTLSGQVSLDLAALGRLEENRREAPPCAPGTPRWSVPWSTCSHMSYAICEKATWHLDRRVERLWRMHCGYSGHRRHSRSVRRLTGRTQSPLGCSLRIPTSRSTTMNFHLPYHFVPFEQPSPKDRLTVEQYMKEPGQATHAVWKPGTHSGRIVCRLETVTPIFIGSHRDDSKQRACVNNYRLNGEIAIPATSLRGMVSSLAEAASNSALRVLNTRARYSVRKPLEPEYVLSAIGMIRWNKETGYKLQPLCVPTLRADRDGVARLPEDYQGLFPEPNLKVYLGDYNSIRNSSFPYRTFRLDAPEWWAMPLQRRSWLPGFKLSDDDYQHRKPISTRSFVLGQDPILPRATPVKWQELGSRVAEADRSLWLPGVMRVLGCWGNREKSEMIPTGKKHELFLPWPASPNWPVVPLSEQVVEEFHALCDERAESKLVLLLRR